MAHPQTTLLDLTQDLLSDMDSDEVNDISDTTESQQIARIIRNTFNEICDEYYLESNKELIQLEGLGDTDKPTHLRVPDGVYSIESLEYDVRDSSGDPAFYRRIIYLEPSDFLQKVTHHNNESNIQVVEDFGGGLIQVRTDTHPSFYTTFDSKYLILDAFSSTASSTLMGSRTRALGSHKPYLPLASATVIDLPPHLISLLRAESKVYAFDAFKDGAPVSVMRSAMRQRVRAKRLKHMVKERRPGDLLPDYGRHV